MSVIITPRGSSLMKVLTRTPARWIKEEVDEMTPAEAADIWGHLEPFLPNVAAKAGISVVGMKWGMLLRKMQMIQTKAEEVGK